MSSQQRQWTTRSRNRSWWWCVWRSSVSAAFLLLSKEVMEAAAVFMKLVFFIYFFSICKQAGGGPVRGAGTESGGHSATAGGDQLAARSDRWPAGSLQRGEGCKNTTSETTWNNPHILYDGVVGPRLAYQAIWQRLPWLLDCYYLLSYVETVFPLSHFIHGPSDYIRGCSAENIHSWGLLYFWIILRLNMK